MSFWIYNMGLAVPVSSQSLMAKHSVKSLRELSKTTDFNRKDEAPVKPKAKPAHPRGIAGYAEQIENKPQLMPVSFAEQIMSTKVKYLYEDMKLSDARTEFRQYRYRHFPVVNKNRHIVGILSDQGMLIAAATKKPSAKELGNSFVRHVMKQPVLTASKNSLIAEVCQIMFSRHIGALPITDEKNKMLGSITCSDILRSMIKHEPLQLWI